eukprot:m.44845 g.44845  ORF g.44845 m.44845 type:complete len:456 (-) comp6578_c0_seq1:18-1385(-)
MRAAVPPHAIGGGPATATRLTKDTGGSVNTDVTDPTVTPTHNRSNSHARRGWNDPRTRQLVALTLGRSLQGASIMLSIFASPEVLVNVFRGDRPKTQRVLALIGTGTTLLTFGVGPLSGALMDAIGRRPFLIGGSAVAAMLRYFIAFRPTVSSYIVYRFALTLATMPFFSAFRAAVADLTDRTTDEYARVMATIDTVATVTRMSALALSGWLSPRQSLMAGAMASGVASLCFAVGAPETLKHEDRRPIDWAKIRNPFASFQTLAQSRRLARLAILSVLLDVPEWNSTLQMYRSQCFGWSMRENSQMALVGQLTSLSRSFVLVEFLRRSGTRGTAVWSQRLGAAAALTNALVADPRFVILSPIFQSLRHGDAAFDRIFSVEAKESNLGEGEKEFLLSNLSTLSGLVLPNVYSAIYSATADSRPQTVFLLCACLHLLNAEVVVPSLWPSSHSNARNH